ncbi:hypothetical protein ACFPAF_16575 [Hymenobacter endophyticus]|uniref:Uncharacterized protein n=1 Tax=Hymenobacter endophyticus TaxID=3076335 RepID=A0ABU3TKZ1_9BACT|nr:hypothetical protein [Hymenobacter endophyticus]MDU0372020.1 hypothetical protein [Hymenobacter endophyticus]
MKFTVSTATQNMINAAQSAAEYRAAGRQVDQEKLAFAERALRTFVEIERTNPVSEGGSIEGHQQALQARDAYASLMPTDGEVDDLDERILLLAAESALEACESLVNLARFRENDADAVNAKRAARVVKQSWEWYDAVGQFGSPTLMYSLHEKAAALEESLGQLAPVVTDHA